MAGHSKWANIKHKKARVDSQRGKAFTKLTKEITVCARAQGGDPSHNVRLRQLIEKARAINMPQENYVRAIKKGTGELPGVQYESITYEGYAPNNIAIIVETLSDNRNRTVAELRHLFSSKGGTLGETNSVSWMFDKKGVVRAEGSSVTEDELLEKLLDFDVDNVTSQDNSFEVTCAISALDSVKKAVQDAGLTVDSAEIEWVPKTPMTLTEEQAERVYEFMEAVDDHEDVQHLYTNLG